MDTGTMRFPRGDIRLSDAERDQAVAEFSEHFQAGRLTQDEFDDRSGCALTARTGSGSTGCSPTCRRGTCLVRRRRLSRGGVGIHPRRAAPAKNFLPLARVIIAFVVAAIIAGGLFGGHAHAHGGGSWLVPVVILALILLRLFRWRR